MIYATTRKSTVTYLLSQIAPLVAASPGLVGLQYLDFDGHADVTKIPMTPVLGLSAFGLTDQGGIFPLMIAINCMTIDDPNILNLIDMVDWIFEAVRPGRDYEVGGGVGLVTFGGNPTVNPVQTAEKRPVQQIIAYAQLALPET